MVRQRNNNTTHTPGPRLFTAQQASRSLPLVTRIVQDIQQAARQVRDLQEQLDSLESRGEPGQSEPCLKRLSIARDVYKGYCAELAELGCSLVDQEAGAVEFLAVIGGRQIALSWKPSEPEVAFWHDLGQETSTRRPLTDLADKAEGRIESDAS